MTRIIATIVLLTISTALYAGEGKSASSKTHKSNATTSGTVSTKAAKPVNNTICPITGEAIGSMGEGVTVTYKGHEVKLCCSACKAKFMKDPEAALKKAQESAKK